jgi:hypothetical protein
MQPIVMFTWKEKVRKCIFNAIIVEIVSKIVKRHRNRKKLGDDLQHSIVFNHVRY